MPADSKMLKALRLVRERGTLRPRELAACGIPVDYLDRLSRQGLIAHIGRGLYADPEFDASENHSLAQVAVRLPNAIICLLSALRFHGLTTQSPHEVWVALGSSAWQPRFKSPKIRVFRFSGRALVAMVEEHNIEGRKIKIYSPAKTVADCFKFRSKIGLDVALEALRDCWRSKRATIDELLSAAKICRMTNVMRPYIESLL